MCHIGTKSAVDDISKYLDGRLCNKQFRNNKKKINNTSCFFNNTRPQPYLTRISYYHFPQYKNIIIFDNIRLKSDLILAISIKGNFCIYNKIKPQPYLNLNRTLAIPYFSIFNRIKSQPYLIFAFSTI